MASGATKMSSFNYFQNGKYGTVQQKDMEVSQDLHLKMSKKIAQLTKVWENLFLVFVFTIMTDYHY